MSADGLAFDLWLQATTPMSNGPDSLVLGQSSLEETLAFFGIAAGPVDINPIAGGYEFASVGGMELTLAEGRIVLSICLTGGAFAEAMLAAVMHDASDAAPDFTIGSTKVQFEGHNLEWLATLPNFITTLTAAAIRSGVMPVWNLSGTNYDKWLLVSAALPFGEISGEFRLGFHKHLFEPGAEVDYFLTRLTLSIRSDRAPAPVAVSA
ncbi:MAG: hypothetical protein KKF33_03480 [Alphaproteobacteria bacterium]|nr:hypothetical protein [Alphaproteobacteria bacterium]